MKAFTDLRGRHYHSTLALTMDDTYLGEFASNSDTIQGLMHSIARHRGEDVSSLVLRGIKIYHCIPEPSMFAGSIITLEKVA